MKRILSLSIIATVALICANPAPAQDGNQTDDALERYKATVIATLRSVRKEEVKFIDDVFALVEKGKLPKFVLDRSFLWVRKNRLYSSYPFIYFERVLRIYAKRVKVDIPKFDYSIYNVSGGKTFGSSVFNGQTTQGFSSGSFTEGGKTFPSTITREKTFGSKTFKRK